MWISVVVLLLVGDVVFSHGVASSSSSSSFSSSFSSSVRERPCPDEYDIYPCKCSFFPEVFLMDMDCSAVKSEDQLRSSFQSLFPFKEFRTLTIVDNGALRVLERGVFADVPFEEIHVVSGTLFEVEDAAFNSSYASASRLDLYHNNITFFPFSSLGEFLVLKELDLGHNNITEVPPLVSSTLTDLSLGGNPIASLPEDLLQGLPNLRVFAASFTDLDTITPGIFNNLPHLHYISLSQNLMTEVLSNAFQISGKTLSVVNLLGNNITHVEVGAFPDMAPGAKIYLQDNALETVEEEVWRPLLEGQVEVYLGGNPLLCGCDVAWAVLDPLFITRLPSATCEDGVALSDLDPAGFEQCQRGGEA